MHTHIFSIRVFEGTKNELFTFRKLSRLIVIIVEKSITDSWSIEKIPYNTPRSISNQSIIFWRLQQGTYYEVYVVHGGVKVFQIINVLISKMSQFLVIREVLIKYMISDISIMLVTNIWWYNINQVIEWLSNRQSAQFSHFVVWRETCISSPLDIVW